MRINLSIIAEMLAKHIYFYVSSSELDLDISDIEIFSAKCFESNSETMYLVKHELLPQFLEEHSDVCFATTYCDANELLPYGKRYIVFADGISFETAFFEISRVFRYYREWEMRILHALIDQQKIEDILSLCAQPLNNPIALFDPSFVLIATGGYVPSDHLDRTWSGVLTSGYFAFGAQDKGNDKNLWNSTRPIRIKVEDTTKASTCIRCQGRIAGYLGSTELCAPITDGQLSLMHAIQCIFESNSYLSSMQFLPDRRISVLLTRLLLGYHVEDSAIDYYLRTLSWQGNNIFGVNLITALSGEKLTDEEVAPTIQNIKPSFCESIIFPFEECIAVITREKEGVETRCSNNLREILHSRQLMCIKSLPFHEFSYLRYAYLQCRMLLPLLQDKSRPEIYQFADYYQECVLTALVDSASLTALCNPDILNLCNKRNGKEFVHSLRVFLMHGKNYSEAATELSIHRNTLIYRIEQMEKILNINFHQESESTLFQLYLSTLICDYCGGLGTG